MAEMAGLVVFRNTVSDANGYRADKRELPAEAYSVEYLHARERAERAAAKQARSAAARHVHQELAQHYAELARVAD